MPREIILQERARKCRVLMTIPSRIQTHTQSQAAQVFLSIVSYFHKMELCYSRNRKKNFLFGSSCRSDSSQDRSKCCLFATCFNINLYESQSSKSPQTKTFPVFPKLSLRSSGLACDVVMFINNIASESFLYDVNRKPMQNNRSTCFWLICIVKLLVT